MEGLILLANGFEDTEALTTRDVLTRAGIRMTLASIDDNIEVTSSFGVMVRSDVLLSELENMDDFAFLVLPGGGRGTQNLGNSKLVQTIINIFAMQGKLICAICAAPSILGKLGYLKNEKYTCFAGFNQGFAGDFTGNEVEVSNNFITGRSMRYSIPFALAIIEKMLGKETKEKVELGLNGQTLK